MFFGRVGCGCAGCYWAALSFLSFFLRRNKKKQKKKAFLKQLLRSFKKATRWGCHSFAGKVVCGFIL
jgi:hypothetical protein